MILIVCEKYRTAKTVALAMGAEIETSKGIFASNHYTVAHIPAKFIRTIPLSEVAEGEYPCITEKLKMAVTDKELDRELKALFKEASEVVFASDGGADAQARFFNVCRHFRVGCPRSRMWLTRLSYGAIRGAFYYRESGRQLHRLAQTGLVSKAMDTLFNYNFNQAMLHIGLTDYRLTRKEVIALEHVGDVCSRYDDIEDSVPSFSIFLNVNSKKFFTSATNWENEEDAENALSEIPVGKTFIATKTVEETDRYCLKFHTLLTLSMDAFNNLGFMPDLTTRVAQCLYEKGLISSPLTDNPHLPKELRGHLETVFTETSGYDWEDGKASFNDHAIITLRAAEEGMTTQEVQLYRLIFNRMAAVVSQNPTRKYATIELQVGDLTFTREWEITGMDYDTTPVGVTKTPVEITDADVYPDNQQEPKVSNEFSDVMCSLTSRSTYVDEMMHTNVPFTLSADNYGGVLGSLVNKGLAVIDDNDIWLTPEGQEVYDELTGREFSEGLLTWQFEANDLYQGDQTGHSVMEGFSNALRYIVGVIDPETEV